MKRIVPCIAILLAAQFCIAEEPQQLKDVAYGNHPRQVLDFYQAESDKPTPVVFYIHGGGWQGGDKKTNPKAFLDHGISVVAISGIMGVKLAERLKAVNVDVVLVHPGIAQPEFKNSTAYLTDRLTK